MPGGREAEFIPWIVGLGLNAVTEANPCWQSRALDTQTLRVASIAPADHEVT